MAPQRLLVQITSGSGLGGVYPFVVVCFDGNISEELHKTGAATTEGNLARWNETFELDLATHKKSMVADGRPEPKYLTFFVFDTGVQGVPSLGSAGVLLSTVVERGKAHGDFQIVNGSGTLALAVVDAEKEAKGEGFLHSDKAKTAGKVGAGAVAVGLGALAVHKYRKHRKEKSEGDGARGAGGEQAWLDPNAPQGHA